MGEGEGTMTWADAMFLDAAFAERKITLVRVGEKFRAEPPGSLTEADKAEVTRLRQFLLCADAIRSMIRRLKELPSPSPTRDDLVLRAKAKAAESEVEKAAFEGDVEGCRSACEALLAAMGPQAKGVGRSRATSGAALREYADEPRDE